MTWAACGKSVPSAGGNPDGAADGAAVTAVGVGVVRDGGVVFRLDLVEDGALQLESRAGLVRWQNDGRAERRPGPAQAD
jgi:hypothetical protein